MNHRGIFLILIACFCLMSCGPNGFRLGFGDGGTSNAPPCQGNACGDISITPENPGNTIKNRGTKTVVVSIQWLFGFSCMDFADTVLGGGQSKTFANGGYCNPYKANYAPSGVPTPTPTPDPARISSFTISPSTISAGASAVFKVVLDKPAPAGGTTVGFSSITNTGLTDTIINMPASFQFNPGAKESSITVNTHRITPETTDIVFTAATMISRQSAELKIQ